MSVIETFKNGVKTLKLNRPNKKNAFSLETYESIANILNKDATNDEIVVTIITAEGDYFTSGNDLISGASAAPGEAFKSVQKMVEALLNYPKLLICVVNGISLGIGTTLLALCDIVYASENSVFDIPFVKLRLCLEAGSSYLFPIMLGRSVTSEMVFLGRKLTAKEALHFGLISKIIPHSEIPTFIESLHQYGKLPVKTVKMNKALIIANIKEILQQSFNREFETLQECIQTDEFQEMIINFLNRKKSKL